MVGWADSNYLGWVEFRVIRVFRVPWPNTRTTRINFGYRGLEPGLVFGFFGFGLFGFGLGFFGFGYRVSGFLPSHKGQYPMQKILMVEDCDGTPCDTISAEYICYS